MAEQKSSNTNIKVAIRVRPLISSEKERKLRVQWASQQNIIYQIDEKCQKYGGEVYSFDHIFGADKTNADIYNDIVKDFVVSTLDGLNSTIFAYGQTSSGKTYTMSGNKKDTGVISLAIDNIFDIIEQNTSRKYLIRVSYIEIYNERINDLLDPSNKDIKIREVYPSTIIMQYVKEEFVSSRHELYEYFKRGNENRHIGTTKVNDKSSRSHTIFKITIESKPTMEDDHGCTAVQVSNLNLVDLAGSERVAQTRATGVRLKEGGHINKSLSALGLVIKQLSEGQEFVNFRDSKLTRLLQDSLGGNSKTLIIATITLVSVEDTASTLAFAQRAKTVRNKPQVNEILSDADASKRYAALNAQLQKKLDEQVLINQKLRRIQEENSKEMLRLQQQKEQLEDFQDRKTTPKSRVVPKRRHTIGFSSQKKLFRLPFEEAETSETNETLEDFLSSDFSSTFNQISNHLEPILEEDSVPPTRTPEDVLRIRLNCLEQEYNELVTFTRDEENIFNETSKMADELQEQLRVEKEKNEELENRNKIIEEKFRSREEELNARITELEEKLHEKNENNNDLVEISEIMKQLLHLKDVLNSPQFINEDKQDREDSVLELIEAFNSKVKTSKEIIEAEILKQINNFNQMNHKRISLPNELSSFNHLLNELSLFESDIPVDLINNMKNEGIEDLKLLIKVYESLLKKNEFIGRCSERIKSLEGNREKNEAENARKHTEMENFKHERENFLAEIEKLNGSIDEHRTRFDLISKENENLSLQIEQLKKELIEKRKLIEEKEELSSKENGNLCLQTEQLKKQLIDKEKVIKEKENCWEELCKENKFLRKEISELNTDKMKEISNFTSIINSKTTELDDLKRRQQADENRIKNEMDKFKEQINIMKFEIAKKDKKIFELEEKATGLSKVVENVEEKLIESANSQVVIETLRNSLLTCQQNNECLEQKVKSSELKLQRQKQLFNNLQTQISDLTAALAEKEKIASNSKQETLKLQSKMKETFAALCKIVDYFSERHKKILLVRHSQDQRDRFRNVMKDIKTNSTNLKKLLNLLRTEDCDLDNFSDVIIKCDSSFKEYTTLEKTLLNEHIQQLESSNKAYVEEIMSLRDSKENINFATCPHCEKMKSQLSRLGKENFDRMKQIVDLQTKIYEEQDKKADVQYSEWLKFYRETDMMQQQQIKQLTQQIEQLKQTGKANTISVGVQHDLLQENPNDVSVKLKEKIADLQWELKMKTSPERSTENKKVQCDLLDTVKYTLMKKVCINRKEEIAILKKQLASLRSEQ